MEVGREIKFEYGFQSVNGIIKKVYTLSEIPFLKEKCDVFDVLPIIYRRQFTGLKDKNGKEILEGDIIEKYQYKKQKSNDKKCKVRYLVEWYKPHTSNTDYNNEILSENPSAFNEEPHFTGREIYNEKNYHCHGWSEFANCEIIGNIYENPELLNK